VSTGFAGGERGGWGGEVTLYICKTCGVEYAESEAPPSACVICEDERQYVGWGGQQWTTREELLASGYQNEVRELEPGLTGLGITPSFSIGQRALLVQTAAGNVLYDCVSLLDDETRERVAGLGGIAAITLSHPHFYDAMVSWSEAFGGCPILVPEADRAFVTRPGAAIEYWDGTPREVVPGVTLVQTGGHFPGSAVLHWAAGAEGRGALLVGDSITVVPDRRYVSFMFSYPNLIPTSAATVRSIVAAVEPYAFDRIYGGWWGRNVMAGAKEAVRASAERYVRYLKEG
jgi:glyoxylase-like metal-dependent hydrolase (beta-lactamase superfamily II)